MSGRDLHFPILGLTPTYKGLNRGLNDPTVALFTGLDADGYPIVRFADAPNECSARTTVQLGARDAGQSVLVLFEAGDISRPIVVGVIQPPQPPSEANLKTVSVRADGERVSIEAAKEIVLRCGEASITLTRAGKILIRGAYVSSSSRGVNRVTGATVRLN